MILYGPFARVERLPHEPELAERLGVSRHHVREAIRLLERDGLLETRRGNAGGVFLQTPDDAVLTRTFEGILARSNAPMAQVMSTRDVLEIAAVRLAAENANAEDLRHLKEIVAAQESQVSDGDELNSRFHVALYEASHNRPLMLLAQAVEQLVRQLHRAVDAEFHGLDGSSPHGQIVAAIADRDPDAAERRMRRHLDSYRSFLKGTVLDIATLTVADTLAKSDAAGRQW